MRARVAYISSLGTTAILVAAALLMLIVVGAIVAFRGWPGAANAAGVQSVPLTSPLVRASATLVVARPDRLARAAVRTRPVATATARTLSTAGLVKQVGPGATGGVVKVTGGPGPSMHGVFPQPSRPIPSFPPPSGRNPVTVQLPPASSGGGSTPGVPVPVQLPNPAPGSVTNQVGGTVEQVTSQVPQPAAVETVRGALPIH
jgi:hypothetical protein